MCKQATEIDEKHFFFLFSSNKFGQPDKDY